MSWEEVRLRDYIITLKGFAFKSEDYQEKGIPIVRVSDFTDNSVSNEKLEYLDIDFFKKYEKYSLKFKDILIQTVGSWQNNPASVVGKVVRVPNELNNSLLNQNAVKIISKDINHDFLYYLLKSNYFKEYILSTAQGAANQASITLESIGKFKFKLPSLKIQNKIANILSNYDNLIENNNKRIKLLENMAEELYKEWFVRLRFPNYQNTKIVDGIPEGWEEKNLFDISDVLYGYPLKSSLFNEDKLGEPIVRIRDIKNNSINTFTTERIKDEKYYLKNGDFIVGMDGDFHVGKWSGGKAILNQRVVCFRVDDFVSKYFFYFSVKKEIDYLDSVISGTTVAHLSDRDLKKINILIPSSEIMNKFRNIVDNLYKLEIDLKVKNQNLKETRDLLLPRAISGKLDIKDLDIV